MVEQPSFRGLVKEYVGHKKKVRAVSTTRSPRLLTWPTPSRRSEADRSACVGNVVAWGTVRHLPDPHQLVPSHHHPVHSGCDQGAGVHGGGARQARVGLTMLVGRFFLTGPSCTCSHGPHALIWHRRADRLGGAAGAIGGVELHRAQAGHGLRGPVGARVERRCDGQCGA
jgi:hypothetical protein